MHLSCVSDTDKEKLCLGDTVDLGGGGSDMGPSAALTPAIWDKTIPYDGENFHLEYMDLEEFLMENGIPTLPDEDSLKGMKTEKVKATPSVQLKVTKSGSLSSVALLPIQELDKCDEEVVIITKGDSDILCDVTAGEWGLEDQKLESFQLLLSMYFTRQKTRCSG